MTFRKKTSKFYQHWIRSIGIDGKDLANLLAHHPTIFHNPLMVAKENVKLLKGSGGDGGGEGAARGFPAMRLSDAQAAETMLGAPVLFRRLLTTSSMRAKLRYWGAPVEEGGLGRATRSSRPRRASSSARSKSRHQGWSLPRKSPPGRCLGTSRRCSRAPTARSRRRSWGPRARRRRSRRSRSSGRRRTAGSGGAPSRDIFDFSRFPRFSFLWRARKGCFALPFLASSRFKFSFINPSHASQRRS